MNWLAAGLRHHPTVINNIIRHTFMPKSGNKDKVREHYWNVINHIMHKTRFDVVNRDGNPAPGTDIRGYPTRRAQVRAANLARGNGYGQPISPAAGCGYKIRPAGTTR
jgi:hypothetical protein